MRRPKALGVVFAYEGPPNPHPKCLISSGRLGLEERKILLHAAGPLEPSREDTLDREGIRRPETGRPENPTGP